MLSTMVESICVLKATHNARHARRDRDEVESICVLKATHNLLSVRASKTAL